MLSIFARCPRRDGARGTSRITVAKYLADYDEYIARYGPDEGCLRFQVENRPYEVIEKYGNLTMTNGANALLTALTGGALTLFNNANAAIGVGDSTAAAAAGQTDLQAATNKIRRGMTTGYPTVTGNAATFQSVFGTADANWAWQEWGIFSSATAGAGTMLNRAVQNIGTKVSGSWTFTASYSIS